MPFSLTWDTQDAVPESVKTLVTEKDGKFVLEGETTGEVSNLKGAVKKERDARSGFETQLKRFERFKPFAEADEEEVDQFLDAWSKRGENGNGKGKQEPPKVDGIDKKLHERELKKRDDEIKRLTEENTKFAQENREHRLWTPLRDTAVKAGVIAEDWELVRLDLSSQNRFGFDEDGKIVVLEDGQPSSVSPEKFFKEVYSDQRPKFYKATGAGGGGATGGVKTGSNAKTMKRDAFNALNPVAQSDFLLKEKGVVVD